ncbi:MAG: tRNA lysidine(34) synthetase TilS [Candidatus Omnitrophica bacterium]|nr:tRNA lysidine(34) synthetase TilS [Candidatus Omnitrophota bacterium]
MTLNNVRSPIVRKLRQTIEKFNMIRKGDKVLVAFSGGPDSCALLYILNELKKEYDISICAGHINHMLRGKESLKDEEIVKKICKDLKIPCKSVEKDINKLKKKGESLEEAARRVRYGALEKIAKDLDANKIALGHNKNDQIETVLFRIVRGTGEDGLGGIPEVRALGSNVEIIRPLLDIWRKDIEAYLGSKKIKPRIDSSNLDVKFFRNKIRHELIPYLEKFNPKIKEGLLKISQISKENSEYIKQNTRKILKRISTRMPDAVKIEIDKLMTYPRVLHNNILREVAKEFKELDYANLKEIEKVINSKRANLVLRLSSGVEIAKEYTTLFIRKVKNSKKSANNKNYSYVLKKKSKCLISEIGKTVFLDIKKKDKKIMLKLEDSNQIYFDADKIKLPLTIRTRQKGDRFCPFGMNKEKKLKDFFIDEKITLKERDKVPILVTKDRKILWIAGYRRSNLGAITKKTRRVGRITLD